MPRSPATAAGSRRATNVTLPEALLRDARELGINLSQACERGLAAEVTATRRQRWLEQNQEAIQAYNEHVGDHGLPLAAYRQF
ncbi:MAG: type II toxin-antitoxin system CcdA family antitoxin [Janthinobacterium lividum]